MHIGAVLVLIGTILVFLAMCLYHSARTRLSREGAVLWPYLLCLGVILIGIGNMLGRTVVQ